MSRTLSVVFLALAISAACGGDAEEDTVAGGKGGGTASGGSTGTGGSVAIGCQEPGDCKAGEFCSAGKFCVPDGGCGVDQDCSGATYCSASKRCIPSGTCAADEDCDDGMACDASGSCVPGGGCDQEVFEIEAIAPNLFISLDRSCSMRRNLTGELVPAGPNKWTFAVAAINRLTTTYAGKIRWGLGLFPDTVTPSCEQSSPAFAVGDGNESAIQTLLTNALQLTDPNFPDSPCVTNIDTGMLQASQEPAFEDTSTPGYVLLITDGRQSDGCSAAGGDAGTTQIIKDLFQSGVPTFVVGFGGAIDPAQMNIFADAGGVPNSDPNARYYKADSETELDAALSAIAGKIAGCSFALNRTPPDPSKLYVFFDRQGLPRDPSHQKGWDYDPATNSITFYGSDCESLKQGKIGKVDVVFGCNRPPPT
jgi:hypothetical protein